MTCPLQTEKMMLRGTTRLPRDAHVPKGRARAEPCLGFPGALSMPSCSPSVCPASSWVMNVGTADSGSTQDVRQRVPSKGHQASGCRTGALHGRLQFCVKGSGLFRGIVRYSLSKFLFIDLRERKIGGERERSICCSTY